MANPYIDHVYSSKDQKTYDVRDAGAERAENKVTKIRPNPTDTNYPSEKATADALALKEDKSHKVSSWSNVPDNDHYPSEKLVKETMDAMNTATADSISAVATVVVSALPDPTEAKPGVNYILTDGDNAILYKYVNGWKMIGGSKATILDQMPATGDVYTDYYVKNEVGMYIHYRYADGRFVAIGTDSYTKADIDGKVQTINTALGEKEASANRVTEFQQTPDHQHYPSEKLVKDALDAVRTDMGNDKTELEGKISATATLIVTALPAVKDANPNVEYILKQGSGALLYKVIDGQWKMVGGAMVSVLDMLPESGDAFTDYYIATDDEKTYLHYRFGDSGFYAVGADAYSKSYIDESLKDIRDTHKTDKDSLDSAIQQANRNIEANTSKISELGDQQKTYSAELQPAGDGYTFRLLESVGDAQGEVVSSFKLPSVGTGGGGTTSATTLTVERVTETPIILTPTDKAIVKVNFSSVDTDSEPVDAAYTLKMGSSVIMTGPMVQGENTFDVTDFCAVGTQKLTLTVTDDGGSTNVKAWTIQVADVRIESAFSDRYANQAGKSVNFSYTPYGSVSKTVHFKLDGVELDPVVTTASGILQSYELKPKSHGAHLLECWITATINSKSIETEHIYRDIIWQDASSDDPVIGCIYRTDYYGYLKTRQYNVLNIPYVVYDPRTANPSVTLSIDGKVVSEQHVTTAANVWSYKPDTAAVHTLTITCRNKSVTIRVDVSELDYDIHQVTANMEFDFNPTGLTNASKDRLWKDKNNPGVSMTVSSNFDWNNGGYQIDEDGNQYFCVKSGTRAYFSHNLFGADPKRTGAEFKLIFKTTNVRSADALFLSCVTGNPNDKPGIAMYVHDAFIYTSADTLKHPYSEEDTIEFEYNVNPIDSDAENATSFIHTYEDGVGARPLMYTNDDGYLLHQLNPVPITVGSDDCDVHIYRMKAYSSALTDSDILRNFEADARDSDTMIQRHERNMIYNENGDLTPESVAAARPDLKVIKISAPHFTNDKKDYVKNTSVECIHKNGDSALDNWKFINGFHAGQGTTSNRYGLAGRNIDIIFGFDGVNAVLPVKNVKLEEQQGYVTQLTLGDGTRYTGKDAKVALTRTSVPNTWFNIKVNIASSENANNALLQKRYNEFLPYKTPAMRRDPRIKNSMEFVNCVIFIQETDPDLTTHLEFADTNWHFYALGNLGDSKKTDNTRVNDPTDMSEFVVEISDNTLPNSTFDTGVYLNARNQITFNPEERVSTVYPISKAQWQDERNLKRKSLYDTWDKSFEFRYDMGTKDGETISDSVTAAQQEKSKQVWRDMYEWVVTASNANFVSQMKNWFIVESPLYWYLFTERYTMTDSRSKNTFWHWGKTYISKAEAETMGDNAKYYTIDDTAAAINNGYRFDLWNYDDDTALGIDNNGELNMTYGHEDTDYKTDGDPSSGYIFNAADSVFWCRIRDLMNQQLREMYRSREALNCWSASSLITEFDNWQNQFPEELWRLNYEREYFRPFYSGNPVAGISPNASFLKDMMNGRKKYQRRQFERSQEIYMGTKYFGLNQCADTRAISFRCNTPQQATVRPDYTLRIVPYSDMYIWVAYGNDSDRQSVRAKAGQEYTFKTALTSMDDTMILIYCAENIQALNDLSACYIRANDFSLAKRLKTLSIGSDAPGYNNPFITTLSIKDNALLETLDIRNCSNLTGSLNFSGCPNLTTLLAEGTAVTGVTFAKNGKIKTAHLPGTVTALSFVSLNYLTDFQMASYGNLVSLVSEYCAIDTFKILKAALSTLQIVRILGIDWSFYNTDEMNMIYAMSQSVLSGKVEITGPIRNSEIANYGVKWPDLELKYNSERIVPQYNVIYRNYDGTELCRTLVDKGATPPNPIQTGILKTTPTRPSDAQYRYTYSGWSDLDSAVNADKSIYVTYTTSTRTYTVSWFLHEGQMDPLYSVSVPYGSEAVYAGDLPVDTSDEASNSLYKVFKGWDKSTGYVRGNMNVYAKFLEAYYPEGKELVNMNAAEVYAVSRARKSRETYQSGDYVDIRKGIDFDFSNVKSSLLLENRWFDGTDYVATDIQLFKKDAPSFTLAIDYEFLSTNTLDATIASCFDPKSGDGFSLAYVANSTLSNTYSKLTWANQASRRCGAAGRRNIIVLRHAKGDTTLWVYCFNGAPTNSNPLYYDPDMTVLMMQGPKEQVTDCKLTFGAARFDEAGSTIYAKNAQGWIHWCKVWYDDLGEDNCRKLAAWPHEISRPVYIGSDRQLLGDSSVLTADAQFYDASALPQLYQYSDNNGNYAIGTWEGSKLQRFCRERVLAGYPQEWQSAMKLVQVLTSKGANSNNVNPPSLDKIYPPAIVEVFGLTTYIYMREQESGRADYYNALVKRLMFPGIIIEDRNSGEEGRRYFAQTEDPGLNGYKLKDGDIWYRTNYSNTFYVYVSAENAKKHSWFGGRSIHDASSSSGSVVFKAYDGGFWIDDQDWYTRSPNADYANNIEYVYGYNGNGYTYGSYSGWRAIVTGFSV